MPRIGRIAWAARFHGRRIVRRLRMHVLKGGFRHVGKNVTFDPDSVYTFNTISLGFDVALGVPPVLLAANFEIHIGNKVMFGPYVTLIGGGHNTAEVGRFMFDVKTKRPGDDRGIVIGDDVWVGVRAIILRGVRIGRGSIVGAGAVVTRSVPPYSVVVGSPARVVKFRWDVDTILAHERALYDEAHRLSRAMLEASRKTD